MIRQCLECGFEYDSKNKKCPYCKTANVYYVIDNENNKITTKDLINMIKENKKKYIRFNYMSCKI